MELFGFLTLAGHRFPIHHATFRRIIEGQGQSGWEFNVCTQAPLEEPAEASEQFLFANGVRFYAEGDPLPLPDQEDLTGVELLLKEPFDPESGEVYFTLYVCEHEDVSDIHLRFVERRGDDYRMLVSGLAHHLFEEPVRLEIDTWIKRLPAGRYGVGA